MTSSGQQSVSKPMACMKRIEQAINQHNVDAMASCFDPDYHSQFPAHPERAFRGLETMRRNWTQIFANVPDIHATLMTCISDGDTVWAEWEWTGTTREGQPYLVRGVTIQGVPDDHITWTRLYMEPVLPGAPAARMSFPDNAAATASGER